MRGAIGKDQKARRAGSKARRGGVASVGRFRVDGLSVAGSNGGEPNEDRKPKAYEDGVRLTRQALRFLGRGRS